MKLNRYRRQPPGVDPVTVTANACDYDEAPARHEVLWPDGTRNLLCDDHAEMVNQALIEIDQLEPA